MTAWTGGCCHETRVKSINWETGCGYRFIIFQCPPCLLSDKGLPGVEAMKDCARHEHKERDIDSCAWIFSKSESTPADVFHHFYRHHSEQPHHLPWQQRLVSQSYGSYLRDLNYEDERYTGTSLPGYWVSWVELSTASKCCFCCSRINT